MMLILTGLVIVRREIEVVGFYLPVIVSVGRLAVGALRAGRCYRRLARVPSVSGLHDTRDYTDNLAHPFVS